MIDPLLDRADLLLLLVAVALYITDLARLLYVNELLFVGGANGRWSFRLPERPIEISRRFLLIARPLDPRVSILRLAWPGTKRDSCRAGPKRDCLDDLLRQLRWPRLGCTLLLPQIFLGLPLFYLAGDNFLQLSILLLVIYLQVAVLVVWLFVKRSHLGLRWPACLLLAFESLICVPYAINLHRKLTEHLTPSRMPNDVLDAGALLLAGRPLADFHAQIRERTLLLLEQKRADSGWAQSLRDLLSRLDERSGSDEH